MKNILVPTDFSACATNAVEAAFMLAKKFESVVHVLHVITDNKIQKDESEWQQAIDNASVLLEKIKERHEEVDTTTLSVSGKLIPFIKDYVDAHGIDLVVMGSHGASGKQEYFIGSNTQKAVRILHCPVLVIKEKLESLDFDKVVFASNFNVEEKGPFMKFKSFIKHFIPEIHLVNIHTSSLFDPPYTVSREAMNDFKALCAPFECQTHIYRDFTIERGIRAFSSDIGAQLIAVSNHQRHPIRRMLRGSNVEALVNHANIPVLSIDYKE